jgi:tetratricopeptide (TPR) repeat protein
MLGAAYTAFLGWTAVEIVQVLGPARDLAVRLDETEQLLSILWNIGDYYNMRCEYSGSLKVGQELDALAQSHDDREAFVMARSLEAHTQCFMGNFRRACRAGDQVVAVYDSERHGHFVHAVNMDLKCNTLLWAGYGLWALGYPDRAKQAIVEMIELAHRLRHPFNLCWDLLGGTFTLLLRGETRLARHWIAEARAVAHEHAMTYLADVTVPLPDALALIEQGDFEEGYAKYAPKRALWRAAGGVHLNPYINEMLARALIGLQRFDEAKELLSEAVDIIDRTGHRMHEAEVHRVFGELFKQQAIPDTQAAETSFLKSLEVARSQEAKGFELRTAMSLAQLWQDQGRHSEAHELLMSIYDWFTEGFDTRDLIHAKVLLEKLRL